MDGVSPCLRIVVSVIVRLVVAGYWPGTESGGCRSGWSANWDIGLFMVWVCMSPGFFRFQVFCQVVLVASFAGGKVVAI